MYSICNPNNSVLKKLQYAIFICIIFCGCKNPRRSDCNFGSSPQELDSCNNIDYKTENFSIIELAPNAMPYIEGYSTVNNRPIRDDDSIPMMNFEGKNYYHPVYLAQYGLDLLDAFTTTQDSSYILEMEKIADKIFDISVEKDSSLLFPYHFDFYLHDCDIEKMTSPWYSSMAQGQVLSYTKPLTRCLN